MSTTFKYEYLIEYEKFFPCLKVHVEHNNNLGSFALIDSGSSDETYIPRSIATNIGLINSNSKKDVSVSASGKFDVYRVQLKALHILRGKNHFDTFRDITVRYLFRSCLAFRP